LLGPKVLAQGEQTELNVRFDVVATR